MGGTVPMHNIVQPLKPSNPYSSKFTKQVLHDYYDVQCKTDYSELGQPKLKMSKVKRPSSTTGNANHQSPSSNAAQLNVHPMLISQNRNLLPRTHQ